MRALMVEEWLEIWKEGLDGNRRGRHHRLVMMISTFGPFRPKAAAHLKVSYAVKGGKIVYGSQSEVRVIRGDPRWKQPYVLIVSKVDKNVDPSKVRRVPIPRKVLGVRVVEQLENYLLDLRPPTGGFLLAAPQGKGKWRSTAFTAWGNVIQGAYERTFPNIELDDKIGGCSMRKSWPQWMQRAGNSDREQVDICGWSRKSIQQRKGTKEVYVITELDSQLLIKQSIGRRLRQVQDAMAGR